MGTCSPSIAPTGADFAGADLSGVPIFEEAFHHGTRAADEVLKKS